MRCMNLPPHFYLNSTIPSPRYDDIVCAIAIEFDSIYSACVSIHILEMFLIPQLGDYFLSGIFRLEMRALN